MTPVILEFGGQLLFALGILCGLATVVVLFSNHREWFLPAHATAVVCIVIGGYLIGTFR